MAGSGHRRPMATWSVLLRDHHEGYVSWRQFEENQQMLLENVHMQQRAARKSPRGALLTGLVRCGRCGRMMRVFYGMRSVYCSPVLRHPAGFIQAANFRSAIAF